MCEFDLVDSLATGDSIASVTSVKVYDDAGTDVSATMVSGIPTFTGTKVYARILGGTHDEVYWAEIVVHTTLGDDIEDDLEIRVTDKRKAT
jgi:hypothetical protein